MLCAILMQAADLVSRPAAVPMAAPFCDAYVRALLAREAEAADTGTGGASREPEASPDGHHDADGQPDQVREKRAGLVIAPPSSLSEGLGPFDPTKVTTRRDGYEQGC